jgi:hypothetical protein
MAQDIRFDPAITPEEFRRFSSAVSQAIFANPVDPAHDRGLLHFDVGIAVNAIPIDEQAAYWVRAASPDLTRSGYLFVPRLVAMKGLSVATISGSYARIPDSDISIIGGALDVPIIRGSLVAPAIGLRATYSGMRGVEELALRNLGAEVYISKGFGPLTPYAGAGIVRTRSIGEIRDSADEVLWRMEDQFNEQRLTAGLRLSLLIPKIVVEATQGADDRSYAAKVSLGF